VEQTPEEQVLHEPLISEPAVFKISLSDLNLLGTEKTRCETELHLGHSGSALSFIPF